MNQKAADKRIKNTYQPVIEGWNTYNTRSVLSHVLMPEGFAINLGFKNYSSGQVLREALIGRFGEKDEKIHPGVRGYDGGYTQLRMQYHGTETIVESTIIEGNQYLLITPVLMEVRPMALLVEGAILWGRDGYVVRKDGTINAELPGRNLTIWTDGTPIEEKNTGFNGPYLSVALDRPIVVATGERMSAEELRGHLNQAKQKVLEKAAGYGELSEAYHAMRTCMAWDTIYEPEKGRLCTPVSRLWNVNWGGYVIFCWDTYFSSMMAMPEDKELAYSNLITVTGEKTEKGFIPNFAAANDVKSRDRSQPPVGSLALKEIYRKYREPGLIELLFDEFMTWNRWFADHRMLENGQLCWGSDPYQAHSGNYWEVSKVNCTEGGALESGLDNSPMYDNIPFDEEKHIMMLSDVGLTGLYLYDCENLAELAIVIGRQEAAAELRQRAALVKNGLEAMWDEDFGMYCNVHTDTGKFSHRLSPTNFYALFSDKVAKNRMKRMLKEHFYNPEEFFGEYILPTIAKNDPAFLDQDYWRGRIWAPTNFLTYLAFRKQGLKKECGILAEKSRKLLMKEWIEHGHVHENYNGITGEGCDVASSDKFYHWGGLLAYIALTERGDIPGPEEKL